MKIWITNADVLTQEKIQELRTRILEDPPHILAISEVKPKHYKHELTLAQYSIPGYEMEPCNIGEDTGRGMLLYIQNSLVYNLLDLHQFVEVSEAQVCELKLNGSNSLLFCSIYRSPNSSKDNNDNVNNLIRQLAAKKSSHLLIAGDLNYPDIDW